MQKEEKEMGYILPVTQHQYINYANRIIEEKNPYHINSLSKVRLTANDFENNMPDFQQIEQQKVKLNDKDSFHKVYIELTGKGETLDIKV